MAKKRVPLPKIDFTDKKQGFAVVLIGIVIALVLGVLAFGLDLVDAWIWWVLAIGVIVGILNIFHEEGVLFLLAGLTLTYMLNVLASITLFPLWAVTLFNAVVYLLTPATIIVGIKILYALAAK